MRQERTAWLTVVLLVVGVLVPTSTVVWFINQSVQRETGAAQQTLLAAYREQLRLIRGRVDGFWSERARTLTQYAGTGAAGFQRVVAAGLADSVVLVDGSGVAMYPTAGMLAAFAPGSADLRARAAQADLRDRLKNGDRSGALAAIERDFIKGAAARGRDADGRLIAADELLLAIHLVHPGDRRGPQLVDRLTALVNTYDAAMPSAQRLFLMDELAASNETSAANRFPTLAAERLAASFLESQPVAAADSGFHRTRLPDVWALTPTSGRVTALYRTASIGAALNQIVTQSSSSVVRFVVVRPGDATAVDAIAASTLLPDWHIAFTITDPGPAQAVVRRRIATSVWVGVVAIAVIAGVAILLGRSVQQQVRVTRLKTDLVAAVSHELKTPLSSMRLLVDALLEDATLDETKTREYLQLIASENQRLSRVVENFLTFSRIERNRLQLTLGVITPAQVVESVLEAMRERFPSAPTHILVETEPGLPRLRADGHALVMALLNLLDNAYKYTAGDRAIRLRTFRDGEAIVFAVQDNGIGISADEQAHIFGRFYRVDAKPADHVGGSGLGLAIVDFIARSHGGWVTVESTPGVGSTFMLSLPCDMSTGAAA
jgi:two-component system, OmpR family, phosphate regulon sensor histidine kinase PhoR